jgi:hypothetical protein
MRRFSISKLYFLLNNYFPGYRIHEMKALKTEPALAEKPVLSVILRTCPVIDSISGRNHSRRKKNR